MAHDVLGFLFIDLSHCVVRSSMSVQQLVHLRLQGLRVAVLSEITCCLHSVCPKTTK